MTHQDTWQLQSQKHHSQAGKKKQLSATADAHVIRLSDGAVPERQLVSSAAKRLFRFQDQVLSTEQIRGESEWNADDEHLPRE